MAANYFGFPSVPPVCVTPSPFGSFAVSYAATPTYNAFATPSPVASSFGYQQPVAATHMTAGFGATATPGYFAPQQPAFAGVNQPFSGGVSFSSGASRASVGSFPFGNQRGPAYGTNVSTTRHQSAGANRGSQQKSGGATYFGGGSGVASSTVGFPAKPVTYGTGSNITTITPLPAAKTTKSPTPTTGAASMTSASGFGRGGGNVNIKFANRGGGSGGAPRGNFRGGRGNFNRSGGDRGAPRSQTVHYCDICKISCAGPQTYKEHLDGTKHKKKQQMQSQPDRTTPKNKTAFRCDLCDVTSTSQDSYNAHVRGAKHQKTLKLHQQLGKPLPSSEDATVIQPRGGSGGYSDSDVCDGDVQPVGEDYVDPVANSEGKVVQYKCRLCDCSFSDLGAKDMHLKGRRHRLQFKKKVNPELEVEVPRAADRGRRDHRDRDRRGGFGGPVGHYRQQGGGGGHRGEFDRFERFNMGFGGPPAQFGPHPGRFQPPIAIVEENDRYLLHKHNLVYPTEEELTTVQRVVVNLEKVLKLISDHMAEQDNKPIEVKAEPMEATDTEAKEGKLEAAPESKPAANFCERDRLLKGVMRVGVLAKGLVLRDNLAIQLVVLCAEKPSRTLLKRVLDLLPKHIEEVAPEEKLQFAMAPEEASLIVTSNSEAAKIRLQLIFTSVLFREPGEIGSDSTTSSKPDPPDMLNKQKCLEALASLRHAKWFQNSISQMPACLIVLRVLRDLCMRVPTWTALPNWSLELLVQKLVAACSMPLSPAEAFRRVFEGIASGILLTSGPGIADACEKDLIDTVAGMTPQQREDLTASAQHALRMIAFGQIHKVLGIDPLPRIQPIPPRKRPAEDIDQILAEADSTEIKRECIEEMPMPESKDKETAATAADIVEDTAINEDDILKSEFPATAEGDDSVLSESEMDL